MALLNNIPALLGPLARHAIMNDPPKTMTTEEQVDAWVVLDWLEKQIEPRKAALREELLAKAAKGVHKSASSTSMMVSETEVSCEQRPAKLPEEGPFRQLLEEKHLNETDAFSSVSVLKMDPSKINQLIAVGKLKEDEVERLKKVTLALKVAPGPTVKTLLENVSLTDAPSVQPPAGVAAAGWARR